MATTKTAKSSTSAKKTTKSEKDEVVKEVKATPKKFADSDPIMCRSLTNGELLMVGDKTGILYRWADYGDKTEVEYQDLIYDTRSARSGYTLYPRYIVEDDDFVEQNKAVKELYESLYSTGDLRDILKLPSSRLKTEISKLPVGVRETLKGLASTMVQNGQLDSVNKIKILDDIFDTKMLVALVDN